MKIKPIYLHSRFLPLEGFKSMTILCFVIVRMQQNLNGTWEKQKLTEREERHEIWHIWQQLCLFGLGVVCAAITHFSLWLADVSCAWLAWAIPFILPFAIYSLCWWAEVLLPPYGKAYVDICFESEAQFHEFDPNPCFIPFSFLLFIPNKKTPTYWGIGQEYFSFEDENRRERLRQAHKFLRILGY